MRRKVRKQAGETRRTTYDADRLIQLNRRLEEPMSDEFWQYVRHADHDLKRAADSSTRDHLRQFVPDREDLFGVPENRLTDIGQHKSSPRARE